MRSLLTKLVLAFLVASIAAVLLSSVIIRQLVTRQFEDYVIQQQRDIFITGVEAYYTAHGSLTGVESWLRQQGLISPGGPGPGQNPQLQIQIQSQPQPQSQSQTQPGGPGQPQGRGNPPSQFGLVDMAGVVMVPFNGHATGTSAGVDEITRGTPVMLNGVKIATVITTGPAALRSLAEEQFLSRTDLALVIAGVAMVGIALLLGTLMARLITRPLRELTAAAGMIASGHLGQQVPVRSRDELGVLAGEFNLMSANLAHATQLRRQMTADIAHDLRTPLTVVSGYMEALRDQVLKPTTERFALVYDEIQLLRHLVEDLHTLSLADAGELQLDRQPVTPQTLLGRVADAYHHAAQQQGVSLTVQAVEPLPEIKVDVENMIRALGNLVSNALRYTSSGGQVTLSAQAAPAQVRLVVADTGEGIAPEHLPNIFERSYRADTSRQRDTGGSGLGLAIVKSIVEAHGGQVQVESALGQGTSFTIMLPASQPV